jgi:hypothetical protein
MTTRNYRSLPSAGAEAYLGRVSCQGAIIRPFQKEKL